MINELYDSIFTSVIISFIAIKIIFILFLVYHNNAYLNQIWVLFFKKTYTGLVYILVLDLQIKNIEKSTVKNEYIIFDFQT